MRNTDIVPTGWSDDDLTKFLDIARQHQLATFANKKSATQMIIEIDRSYCRVIDDWRENPPDLKLPLLLFFRAHCSYRAAASCAFAGHAIELFPLLRSMLEQGGYAILLNDDSELKKVWLSRENSRTARDKVRKKFTIGNIKSAIASSNPALARLVDSLYERTIDFGAHPNELSVKGGVRVEEVATQKQVSNIYLHDGGLVLEHSLLTLAQVGACVLLIFQEIFREQFERLDISSELLRLREKL